MNPESTLDESALIDPRPFELQPKLLEDWTKLALEDPEFQNARQQIGDGFLLRELRLREEKVRTAAAQEMAVLKQAEEKWLGALRHLDSNAPGKGRFLTALETGASAIAGVFITVLSRRDENRRKGFREKEREHLGVDRLRDEGGGFRDAEACLLERLAPVRDERTELRGRM